MPRNLIGIVTSRSAAGGSRWWAILLLTISVCFISLLHYITSVRWFDAHEIFQRLYYVPIVVAAVLYGQQGGIATAALSAALYLPHVILTPHGGTANQAGQYAEMAVFLTVGLVTGRLADAVRASVEERLRADRLVTIGRLASGIAHEIRTPLGGLLGSLEILGSESPGNVPKAEFMAIAKSQIERLNHVVADFLDFAYPPPPVTQDTDVTAVVNAAVRLASSTVAVSGGVVHVSAPHEILRVKVDIDQVERALLNLLLDERVLRRDVGIVITEDRRRRVARVLVVPTEPVRVERDIADLFEPFPGSDPGAGLTLAMTRRLIENQGGSISANVAAGTLEYVIELPLVAAQPRSSGTRPTRRTAAAAALIAMLVFGAAAAAAEPHGATTPPRFAAAVDLVALDVCVRDGNGRFVADLSPEDFLITENGAPQKAAFLVPSNAVPLTAVLLIDVSQSMEGEKLRRAIHAARRFAELLGPDDRVAILAFNHVVTRLHAFGDERAHIPSALSSSLKATGRAFDVTNGSTALYDALLVATNEVIRARGTALPDTRKVIVVLSDGEDTSSRVGFDEALPAVQRSGALVYSVSLKTSERGEWLGAPWPMLALARETGAQAVGVPRLDALADVYRDIFTEVRHLYRLAYVSTDMRADGRWRTVAVRVPLRDVRVRARSGYYAPRRTIASD